MTLVGFALIAFINGNIVAITRALNGRLSQSMSPLKSSMWNHLVGFVVLTPFFIIDVMSISLSVGRVQWWMLTGGAFGCLFVAISSAVFSRLGALLTALMVVGGQLIAGQLIDYFNGKSEPHLSQCLGILAVFAGVALSLWARLNGAKQ